MAGSYREIDYRIRPAKYAERLMMCDAFRRLRFATVESYQYVGLGSVYFADFVLFHRALGISRMISIEKEVHDEQRFLDNRPFRIDMCWGRTTSELPKINLDLRTIIWLDYDDRLSRAMLDDVRSVATRAVSGSVLVVSVQCQPEGQDEENPRKHVDAFAEQLGSGRVDPNYEDRDLLGWGTARVFREIILNEIAAVLSQRNGVRPPSQHMEFEQIFNFHYKDGARMLTVGGVIFDRGQRPIFEQCAFGQLEFVRHGEDAFRIDIPKLTTRELRLLEMQMPAAGGASFDLGSMPEREAKQFARIYRYFPNFANVEL